MSLNYIKRYIYDRSLPIVSIRRSRQHTNEKKKLEINNIFLKRQSIIYSIVKNDKIVCFIKY